MVEQDGGFNSWPPNGAPLLSIHRDDHLRNFDDSVSAVSFGFVATAILISMFLIMAIFERFLRPTHGRTRGDVESQMGFNSKLAHPSPKMTVYASGVSVLMPGDNVPTFIAHPAPMPCSHEPPERVCCPLQLHSISFSNPATTSNANSSSSQEEI